MARDEFFVSLVPTTPVLLAHLPVLLAAIALLVRGNERHTPGITTLIGFVSPFVLGATSAVRESYG
jgi:hypothetical protein